MYLAVLLVTLDMYLPASRVFIWDFTKIARTGFLRIVYYGIPILSVVKVLD